MWRPTRRRVLAALGTTAGAGLPAARSVVDTGRGLTGAGTDPVGSTGPDDSVAGAGSFSLDWQRTYGDDGYDRLDRGGDRRRPPTVPGSASPARWVHWGRSASAGGCSVGVTTKLATDGRTIP